MAIRIFRSQFLPPDIVQLPPLALYLARHFQLLEMEYDDGGAPPLEIINKWLDVVRTTFHDAPDSSGPNGSEGPTIAVHCVAGLGRAPVLVAIALIEYGKVSGVECAMQKSRAERFHSAAAQSHMFWHDQGGLTVSAVVYYSRDRVVSNIRCSLSPMLTNVDVGSTCILCCSTFDQDPIKAVEYIRDRRRGAINRKQLSYLDNYERRSRGNGCSSCVIM